MRTIKSRAQIHTVFVSKVTCVSASRHHKWQWPTIRHPWMLAGPGEAKRGREKECQCHLSCARPPPQQGSCPCRRHIAVGWLAGMGGARDPLHESAGGRYSLSIEIVRAAAGAGKSERTETEEL